MTCRRSSGNAEISLFVQRQDVVIRRYPGSPPRAPPATPFRGRGTAVAILTSSQIRLAGRNGTLRNTTHRSGPSGERFGGTESGRETPEETSPDNAARHLKVAGGSETGGCVTKWAGHATPRLPPARDQPERPEGISWDRPPSGATLHWRPASDSGPPAHTVCHTTRGAGARPTTGSPAGGLRMGGAAPASWGRGLPQGACSDAPAFESAHADATTAHRAVVAVLLAGPNDAVVLTSSCRVPIRL